MTESAPRIAVLGKGPIADAVRARLDAMGAHCLDRDAAEGWVLVGVDAPDDRPSLVAGETGDDWRTECWALCEAVLAARRRPTTPGAWLHPTVVVDGPVSIGEGTRVWHYSKLLGPLTIGRGCSLGQNVVVERGVRLGDRVKVQNNVSIYAGVVLEDDVFCGPSMVFTNVSTPRSAVPRKGDYQVTRVERGASIGANATIVCGHTLGAYCFVGAGAVVTRDVPPHGLVYGNPARLRGWACYCGARLPLGVDAEGDEAARCEVCGRGYRRRGEAVVMEESER